MPFETKQDLLGLLDGCAKWNRKSQHELYRLFYPYGMSIAIRYIQNEADSISVVNDAFMKVYKHLEKFDRSKPFKPWFRRIVVNTALTQIAKEARRTNQETSMNTESDFPDRENILSQIGYKELMGLVQSLSTAYRAVFNMYVIDGFKHEEIAKSLGISVSTSKTNLSRARKKLQELVTLQLQTNG
ncbi:MAG: RNA polymerase sigma factor [Saprospiraceae bacterium]